MADLPIIISESPVTTPAIAEVTYDALYVVGLKLSTGDEAGYVQPLEVTYRPYAYASKTLYPDSSRDTKVTIANIWPPALAYPLVGQVMGGLITVIPVIEQIQKLHNAVTGLGSAISSVQSRITAIDEQIALGGDTAPLVEQKTSWQAELTELQGLLVTAQAAADTQLPALEAALGA